MRRNEIIFSGTLIIAFIETRRGGSNLKLIRAC